MTKTIEIEVPNGKRAEWVNNVLTLVEDKPKDVTERIKTVNDAARELGKDNIFVKQLAEAECNEELDAPDLLAYLKLRVITAALNEGWTPQFTEDEYRYYPWFRLLTKEDYDNLSEEDKGRVVGRAVYGAGADGGLVCAYAGSVSSVSSASFGSRLVFKTRELAEYAGKQFIDIWADFVFKVSEE